MPHRGRRSCQAGLWFLSVWEHVLTPRDRDLNPVLGPVVIAPNCLLYHRWQTLPSATQHVAGSPAQFCPTTWQLVPDIR
jgi:hypothetical protein